MNGISEDQIERKQSIPTTIDVVTLDPEENENGAGSAFSSTTRVSTFTINATIGAHLTLFCFLLLHILNVPG